MTDSHPTAHQRRPWWRLVRPGSAQVTALAASAGKDKSAIQTRDVFFRYNGGKERQQPGLAKRRSSMSPPPIGGSVNEVSSPVRDKGRADGVARVRWSSHASAVCSPQVLLLQHGSPKRAERGSFHLPSLLASSASSFLFLLQLDRCVRAGLMGGGWEASARPH